MTKQSKITPTDSPKPASRAELERKRKGVLGTGPSGAVYRIRKINLERQALEGTMPVELRQAALAAVAKANGRDPMQALAREIDAEQLAKVLEDQKAMNDRLVLATVMEPELQPADLGSGELDDDPLLPAVDYEWLLQVAKGETDRDGEDRKLWGPEPKEQFHVFRTMHGCPDDCEDCAKVVREFTAYLAADAG